MNKLILGLGIFPVDKSTSCGNPRRVIETFYSEVSHAFQTIANESRIRVKQKKVNKGMSKAKVNQETADISD